VPAALGALAAAIFLDHGIAVPAGAGFRAADLEAWRGHGPAPEVIAALAEDLTARRGDGLVLVGDRQPAGAHHLAHVLNAALGGAGKTVTYVPADTPGADLAALTDELQAGRVDTVIILGGDPAATAPADVGFATALGQARSSMHLTERPLATTALCTWRLPRSHYLETWGDAVAADGSYLAVQPLIAPLYESRSDVELLAQVLDRESPVGYDLVRTTFHRRTGGGGDVPTGTRGFEERWRRFLHDGFLGGERPADATPPLAATAGLELPRPPAPLGPENLELIIKADPSIHDGRFANNAWLQEMPDFATKVAWDNVAALGPATAAALGVAQGDLLELEFRGRTTSMPAYVMPGHAPHSITVTLGYGLTRIGRVGDGVGHAAYPLRARGALHGGTGLEVRRTGETYPLACAQDHHAIDPKGYVERESRVGSLVREGTLEHYLENADFVDHLGLHHPPLKSLWQEKDYTGYKWGMSIDLNSCIGCNACVLACQAENNIPVVGKEEIGYSREMHWIRVDRYFKGDPENPDIAAQPVTCVQCEMAPCESVCPVGATMHTEEGLNAMVYNRCVGTRYCANNCPYKVRRFNFFNNIDHLTDTAKMQLNPDVTVRSRGVMEKCTYCVQRIQHAKITARREGRSVRDGEIVPACAQTCPTEAIVFGDLNDPGSRVSAQRADSRSYDMLAFLNIKPRTSYMARIRNPHPELAAAGHGHENHGGESH